MDLPLATVMRGLFTGGSLGWYPASSPALPPPVLGGQHIRIVSTDDPEWREELTRYGMSPDRVDRLRREVGRAWDCLVMDEVMLNQGSLSKREAWMVLHFLEHAHSANVYPAKSVAIVTTHYAQMLWLQDSVCGRQGAGCMGTRHMSVCRQSPPWTGTRVCKLQLSLPPWCPGSQGS